MFQHDCHHDGHRLLAKQVQLLGRFTSPSSTKPKDFSDKSPMQRNSAHRCYISMYFRDQNKHLALTNIRRRVLVRFKSFWLLVLLVYGHVRQCFGIRLLTPVRTGWSEGQAEGSARFLKHL